MKEGVVWFLPFEETFIVWLQQLGAGTLLQTVLVALNNFFSFLGEEIICIGVLGFVYWGFDKKRGERIGAAVVLASVSIGMLKNIFSRVRPWAASGRIGLLRDVDGFSFPSGHSANCTALYPTTAYEFRKQKWLRWVAVLAPLLCGLSRCYVGAHWPTDVLVGLGVGLAVFAAVEFGMARLKNRYGFYLALIVIGAAGMLYCRTGDYYNSFGMLVGFVLGLRFEEKHNRFENTASLALALLRTGGRPAICCAEQPDEAGPRRHFFGGHAGLFADALGAVWADRLFAGGRLSVCLPAGKKAFQARKPFIAAVFSKA